MYSCDRDGCTEQRMATQFVRLRAFLEGRTRPNGRGGLHSLWGKGVRTELLALDQKRDGARV